MYIQLVMEHSDGAVDDICKLFQLIAIAARSIHLNAFCEFAIEVRRLDASSKAMLSSSSDWLSHQGLAGCSQKLWRMP